MKQFLATGKIGSPHGIKGFLKVFPYSDDYSHFFNLSAVILEKSGKQKVETIENLIENGNCLLIKFLNYDSPESARLLSNWEIIVPREEASKLSDGEIYASDLIGLSVLYNDERVGEIVSFSEGPQALLLEVKCLDGKNRFVPYLKGIYVNEPNFNDYSLNILNRSLIE